MQVPDRRILSIPFFGLPPWAMTLLVSGLFLIALEVQRPLFFLTDDNLTGATGPLCEIGRNILSGKPLFYFPNLFGGYEAWRDPSYLAYRSPLPIAVACSTATPFRLAAMDLFAWMNILAGGGGFLFLLRVLGGRSGMPIDPAVRWIVASSYAVSGYAVIVGSSWAHFLGSYAMFPWLLAGVFMRRPVAGTVLATLALVQSVLGGQIQPTAFGLLFGSIWVALYAVRAREWGILARWVAPCFLAGLLLLPFAWQPLVAFGSSERGVGIPTADSMRFAPPWAVVLASPFLGVASMLFGDRFELFFPDGWYPYGIGACAAGALLFARRSSREGRGGARAFEFSSWVVLAVAALFCAKPLWLAEFQLTLPVFKAFRWPFREIMFVTFFLHLLLALRLAAGIFRRDAWLLGAGAALFLVTIFAGGGATFCDFRHDRGLILSGVAGDYWAREKQKLPPGSRIVPAVGEVFLPHHLNLMPLVLVGGFSYPGIFNVPSVSGYSPTSIGGDSAFRPIHHSGVFSLEQATRMLEKDPRLVVYALVGLSPVEVRRIDRAGSTTVWRDGPAGE